MKIDRDSVVVRNDQPLAAKVDGETIILSPEAEAYFGLGGVGSDIWEMIAKPQSVSDLCARLVEEYQVDHQICEQETVDFLTKLQQDDLIEVLDEKHPGK